MPLDRDVETLRNIPLFNGLPTPRLKLIAYTAEVVRFEPGEVIVQQGDLADAVYIVVEGEAEVWVEGADGRSIQVNTMGPNTLFGEIAVLSRGRRTTTVRAKGPVVTFKIAAKVFLDLVRHSPEIGMQVMTVLAERLERTTALLQKAQRG
jgi:CRP-like cAMP-binding protein